MARQSLRYYFELLTRAAANLGSAKRFLLEADSTDSYEVQFRKTVVVKQFELAYELLVKLMFKAADRLPEPEAREAPLVWREAHRIWTIYQIGTLPESDYNIFRRVRNLSVHTYNIDIYEEELLPILATFEMELAEVLARISPMLPDEP